jgi:hypothetical protein
MCVHVDRPAIGNGSLPCNISIRVKLLLARLQSAGSLIAKNTPRIAMSRSAIDGTEVDSRKREFAITVHSQLSHVSAHVAPNACGERDVLHRDFVGAIFRRRIDPLLDIHAHAAATRAKPAAQRQPGIARIDQRTSWRFQSLTNRY